MIFVVRENFFVVGILLVRPNSDVIGVSFCATYHTLCLEKWAKVAIMTRSGVFGGCNNEDLPLHKRSTVKQQAAERELVMGTTLCDDSSTSHCAQFSLFHPRHHFFSNYIVTTSWVVDSFAILFFHVLWPVKMAFASHARTLCQHHLNNNAFRDFRFYIKYRIMTSGYSWPF